MNQAEFQKVLDQIPWHSLQDAYDSALPIRTLLEKIASSSDLEEGVNLLMELESRINHQGVLENCALFIIPALVALAKLPEISVLPSLLSYLLYLTSNGQFESFDPTSTSIKEIQPLQNQIREILSDYTNLWIQFLEHPEPKCRSLSAQLLVILKKPSQKLDDALRLAYQQEKDTKTCAIFLICRAILQQDTENIAFVSELKKELSHSSVLIQTSAAIAHSFVSPLTVNEQIWQLLQMASQQNSKQYFEENSSPSQHMVEEAFACFYENLSGLTAKALVKLGQHHREQAITSLLQMVRHLHQHQAAIKQQRTKNINQLPLSDWWPPQSGWRSSLHQVIQELFSFVFKTFQGRKHNPVLLEELDEIQRQILTVWSYELDSFTSVQYDYGLPIHGKVYMGRYLGMLPKGPLDQIINLEISKDLLPPKLKTTMMDSKWPLWKWIWLSLSYPSLQENIIQQLLTKQTLEENIALCQDVIVCPYLHFSADWMPGPFVHKLWSDLLQQQGDKALPIIRDYANELVKKQNEQEVQAREASLVMEALFYLNPQIAQEPAYQILREKAKSYLQQKNLIV